MASCSAPLLLLLLLLLLLPSSLDRLSSISRPTKTISPPSHTSSTGLPVCALPALPCMLARASSIEGKKGGLQRVKATLSLGALPLPPLLLLLLLLLLLPSQECRAPHASIACSGRAAAAGGAAPSP